MYQLHVKARFVNTGWQNAELSGFFKTHVLSYTTTGPVTANDPMNRMLDGLPTDLPGDLELNLIVGTRRIRFGAWPEPELTDRLDSLRKTVPPPSRQPR